MNSKDITEQQRDILNKLSYLEPIMIYQMGKVGSSSIYKTLIEAGYINTFQIHTLGKKRKVINYSGFEHQPYHLDETDFINNYDIQKNKIITLVRDPIERNISAFFENFRRFVGIPFKDNNFTIEEIKDIFLERFPHNQAIDWYDIEFKGI